METASDRFVVETPENIRFGYDVADIGSRFLAISIDTLIQGIMYIMLLFAAVILESQLTDIELPRIVNDGLAVGVVLAIFLIQFGYFLFLEMFFNGQTVGKRIFHLRVIKDNGYPLGSMDSVVRNLVRIIDFFPLFYGVGIIVMFFNGRAKRLGDFAAGTIVVKLRDEVKLSSLMPVAPAPVPASAQPLQGFGKLTEQDIELAESLLNRRSQLSNPDPLTLQVAQRLATKMELPPASIPTTPQTALDFILKTVSTYRGR